MIATNLVCNIASFQSRRVYNTSARHERHKCDTSATKMRHELDISDTNVTRKKKFDFDNDTSENIFHTSILAIRQMKDRKNLILRNTFWKCLVLIPKCV